ncbi:MAG TPA: gamma-glutamyl-gamma-aminobutyrate hydrolase family protein [Stellaceae bacterium]|jgi:putative glutamine amidotransferase|nr:gamma-glutamyl-gamma-aminobutyrate hydrolase family protein [Stellaceae bacterium]
MSRPVIIGLTLDHEMPVPGISGYSKFPYYAIRENYAGAVIRAGGVPLALPHAPELVATYAAMIDGLIVTGGAFDVDPAFYGESARHVTVTTKDRRTAFEFGITRAMLEMDKPVLGICGGEQLLNVVLGGTLIQHIPDAVPEALAHEQPNPRDQPGHDVTIFDNTLLRRLSGVSRVAVNSAHHQAVRDAAPGAIVNALAPDGVIEGIEHPGYRFCLGVQWHPEFELSQADSNLFRALVEVAGTR